MGFPCRSISTRSLGLRKAREVCCPVIRKRSLARRQLMFPPQPLIRRRSNSSFPKWMISRSILLMRRLSFILTQEVDRLEGHLNHFLFGLKKNGITKTHFSPQTFVRYGQDRPGFFMAHLSDG